MGRVSDARWMPITGRKYPGRRHSQVNGGRPVPADMIVLHWSAGGRELEALHEFFEKRPKEASYHLAFDRTGDAGQFVDLDDAAWSAGDGEFPIDAASDLVARGFTDVRRATFAPPRHFNLRTVAVCFSNRGFLDDGQAAYLRGLGLPVAEGRHQNPRSRSTRWEGYTEAAIDRFVATLPEIVKAVPTLVGVCGHEDVTNCYVFGRGKPRNGSKLDPGVAFPWDAIPWHRFGLVPIRYDYERHGWRARSAPSNAAVWNGPGSLPRGVDPGP